MTSEIETWIDEALEELQLGSRKVEVDAGNTVYNEIKLTYVEGNPRVWWLSFKMKPEVRPNDEGALHDFFESPDAQGWFIPEADDPTATPIYRLSANEAELVIGECPYFEYYFINNERTLLVGENDHNAFLICRRQQRDSL